MRISKPLVLAIAALGFAGGSLAAGEAQHPRHGRLHGGGQAVALADLPASQLRLRLERLPPAARARALAVLSTIRFHDHEVDELKVDEDGAGVCFVCPAPVALPKAIAPTSSGPVAAAPSVPIANPPAYHSRPGASRIVYLDFNGHVITGTAWNNGAKASFPARAFDLDGDPSTFSDAEQTAMREIWQRVSEDYAPFDIDVTTQEPAAFGPTVGRVLITPNTDAEGSPMPASTAGGVAYVNVFGSSNYVGTYSPALVYCNNLGNREDYIAEASAHEFGHNVGLSHDATSTTSYFGGMGSGATSWGPIMGTGYNRNVSQWSKGEYPDANNHEDDLAIISGKLPYRPDDVGDTPAAATTLAVSGGAFSGGGVIGTTGDRDVFRIAVGAGMVTVNASSFHCAEHTTGGDLDIGLRLLDGAGNVIASANPGGAVDASLSANVAAGTYFIEIDGVGDPVTGYSDYASLGQYAFSGTATTTTANQPPVASIGANPTSGTAPLAVSFTSAGSSDPEGGALSYAWSFGDGATATGATASHTYTTAGSYTAQLTVTDNAGATNARTVAITATDATPQPPAPGTGTGIARQWWLNIGGSLVTDLTANPAFPGSPSGGDQPTSFEAPVNWADNYGTRMSGYITAPVAGGYVFLISGDDNCELWLATDGNVGSKVRIASVPGWTNSREWGRYPEQRSATIQLAAGQRCYIEALQKEGGGGDNLAVGWQFPNGALEAPIPGNRLTPFVPGSTGGSTPYGGTARALPGTVQAEDFDEGGEGVAYHDVDPANNGGGCRSTGVDVRACVDAGGGWQVGWMGPVEWMQYSVSVAATGSYDLSARVASGASGATVHLSIDGTDVTGPMTFGNTGGWDTWATVTRARVAIGAGRHLLRLTVDSGAMDLNWIAATASGTGSTPYGGVARAIPGTIQAEDFDEGGEGVAYHDNDASQNGGSYRSTGVDVRQCYDVGGGFQVGWMGPVEWMQYSVNVANSGTYDLVARVASGASGATIHLSIDGVDVTGPMTFGNTGGWDTFQNAVKARVPLGAGPHVLRLTVDSGALDLNFIDTVPSAPSGTAMVESSADDGGALAGHSLSSAPRG